jgi:hypothetical protein
MIEKVLLFIKNQVNYYLNLKTGSDDKLELGPLTDNEGKIVVSNLGLTLVNIEEEKLIKNQQPFFRETPQGTIAKVNPKLMVNLYLLFSANFGDDEFGYRESLKFISYVMSFFQTNQVFTPRQFPELDRSVEKLTAELYTMPFEQMNYLWGAIGSKYLTSVMYKLRMIAIHEDEIKSDAPPVTIAKLKT